MCKKDLRWKLGLLGKIVAFGEMIVQKGYWSESKAFVQNECPEGS